MQRLSSEQYLQTENFWRDYIEVEFIQTNPNGTEKWKVTGKESGCYVYCSSRLSAYKIAHTAVERLEGYQLSIDHSNILSKACQVIGRNFLYSHEIMRYGRYWGGKWHSDNKTDRPIYVDGERPLPKEVSQSGDTRIVTLCKSCNRTYVMPREDKHVCEECGDYVCNRCLRETYKYRLEEILEDGVMCPRCFKGEY